MPETISFGRELKDYAFASKREFIQTSGDSYCSSSLAGNTRKYHGLLLCNGRVYLSSLDEFVNDRRISVARYTDGICDEGLRYLRVFNLYPPTFYYFLDDVVVRKTIYFDGTVRIVYDVWGEAELRIVPLVTDRSVHETRKNFDFIQEKTKDSVSVGALRLKSNAEFSANPDIYWNVFYERDFERGYECVENLYTPGFFAAKVRDSRIEIVAEVNCRSNRDYNLSVPKNTVECLELAADSFIVDNAIYAGYHWFTEAWGRDAFVSLPGLLLEGKRLEEARRVFRFFALHIKNGLIPNRLPDNYNSSDASLWFIYALRKYFEKTGDSGFLKEMKPYIEQIIINYPESEVAKLDKGLISVKACTTWMDTKFTPREGKPIEINALWINALRFAEVIGVECRDLLKNAERAFSKFWNNGGYLYDVVDPDDSSIRPNQIIAVALGVIEGEQAESVIDLIKRKLLTPYGPRSLSSDDRRYNGKYSGDESYHNGCVWPWLLGFYVEACLRAYGNKSKDYCRALLTPLLEHVKYAGLGTISEIFDGNAPHEPNGCISQAWSVAEVLRAYRLLWG